MTKSINKNTDKINLTALIIGFVLTLLSLIHAIKTRTLEDFVKYSLFIIIPIAILNIVFWFLIWSASEFSKPKLEDFWTFLFVVVVIIGIGPVYYACGASIKDAYIWLKLWSQSPTVSKNTVIISFILLALLAGLILFFFRLRSRSVYGLTEALLGLVVAATKIANVDKKEFESSSFYIGFLTAAVYLVVRGLDNIHQGFIKEPLDPIARKILKRVNRK